MEIYGTNLVVMCIKCHRARFRTKTFAFFGFRTNFGHCINQLEIVVANLANGVKGPVKLTKEIYKRNTLN